MKILIFGSKGMAGHMVERFLKSKNYSVDTVARQDATFLLNIENTLETIKFLQDQASNYDFIINCVGLLVKDSINRPDRAAIINAWFPHAIEQAIKNSSTKLIHLSTDCVFDGSVGKYVETDVHTEMNAYGSSKSLGEVNNNKDITFRMSIIGPELKSNGSGLMNWIFTSADAELPGWENAFWNGITTLQLAKCIETYINNPTISGVYHLVNNQNNINKYELLNKINDCYKLGKVIKKTVGPKPINKILIDTRNEVDFKIVDYDTQLEEMKKFYYV